MADMDTHQDPTQSPTREQIQSVQLPDSSAPANTPDADIFLMASPRRPRSASSSIADSDRAPKKQRRSNPEITRRAREHGAIEGVKLFATWYSRRGSEPVHAVHSPRQSGIHGGAKRGVLSILLSKYYKDDKDMGDTIFYTGTGGKDKLDGPQTSGQSWGLYLNQAFKTSLETGKPVRVVRSYECRSKYAPPYGFRYDGLYRVVDCQTVIGQDKKEICLSTLEVRLPGQLPIPVRETYFNADFTSAEDSE